jgi:phage tail sheath gpL-like
MADNNTGSASGFKLPSPTSSTTPTVAADTTQAAGTTAVTLDVNVETTSSRDFLIGGGALLILLVAFFFAKNAYANTLVSKRVQPRAANAAGWWLFVFLALIAAGVILAAISRSVLMTPYIVGPLAAGALVALILTFVSGRR